MPLESHDAQALTHPMTPEHLERDNGRILHQIADHLAVKNLTTPIIAGIRKQRQRRVKRHVPDGRGVEPQRLVRLGAQLEVVPEQALVVGADEQVVAARVHGDAGNPFRAGRQDLDELLLGQVVAADRVAGGDEEERFGWWKCAVCAMPLSRRKGSCVRCLLMVWMATEEDWPRGDTVVK